MIPRSNFESVALSVRNGDSTWGRESQQEVSALCSIAAKALLALFDGTEMLFSQRITLRERAFRREAASPRCTAVALLGLKCLSNSGQRQPFDLASIENAVFQDTSWIEGVGDLGVLIQFAAEYNPDRLALLADHFDLATALNSFPDGREARTAALSCFLAGISHAKLSSPDSLPDLTDAAVDTYHLIQENQGPGGIFAHAGLPGLLQQPFSNRFGTIADQMHAIYALTTFARAFGIEEPLADALNCANTIRALQGDKGQWWFLYDKRSSQIVNRYPVRSICQNGMAPMALLALAEATGQDFDDAICSGLSWVAGANELAVDLRDWEHGIIWDSIEPRSRITNFCDSALNLIHCSRKSPDENLRVRFEARPDHFGWLLYALAGSKGKAAPAKAASAG
jgi:hypothetical protein